MATLGREGHTEVTWDPEDEVETQHARQTFMDMVGTRRFLAFRADEGGGTPTQIRDFDPTAEKILLTPPMVGG